MHYFNLDTATLYSADCLQRSYIWFRIWHISY